MRRGLATVCKTPDSDTQRDMRGYYRAIGEARQKLYLWRSMLAAEHMTCCMLYNMCDSREAQLLKLLDDISGASQGVKCLHAYIIVVLIKTLKLLRRAELNLSSAPLELCSTLGESSHVSGLGRLAQVFSSHCSHCRPLPESTQSSMQGPRLHALTRCDSNEHGQVPAAWCVS